MARGIWKGRPDRALLRERIALSLAVGPSAREVFEDRVEDLREARAAEAEGAAS